MKIEVNDAGDGQSPRMGGTTDRKLLGAETELNDSAELQDEADLVPISHRKKILVETENNANPSLLNSKNSALIE